MKATILDTVTGEKRTVDGPDLPPEWAAKAAEEIDTELGEIVRKNTGIQFGFFAGISINDMAKIIARHCPHNS